MDVAPEGLITWGNYSFLNDIYPDVYKILIENSPTATSIINRLADFITCNINAEAGFKLTTKQIEWSNTLYNCCNNLARDMLLWSDSLALWVGYDLEWLKRGRLVISEFKRMPVHWLRYQKVSDDFRDFYQIEENTVIAQRSCLVSDTRGAVESANDLFFQFDPRGNYGNVLKQIAAIVDRSKADRFYSELLPPNSKLKFGNILWINNSDEQTYPNCLFDGLLQVLLADIGIDSGIASYLSNARIAQSYQKNEASSGAEILEKILEPTLDYMSTKGVLNTDQSTAIVGALAAQGQYSLNAGNGTGDATSGVLAMGSHMSVRIQDTESINNFIQSTDAAKFMDEFKKIQDHVKEKLAERCQTPYSYLFRSTTGILNQENQQTLLEEMNLRFDRQRDIIEHVINNLILVNSDFDFRVSLKALGEDKGQINTGL